jgi:hypothetical protein
VLSEDDDPDVAAMLGPVSTGALLYDDEVNDDEAEGTEPDDDGGDGAATAEDERIAEAQAWAAVRAAMLRGD